MALLSKALLVAALVLGASARLAPVARHDHHDLAARVAEPNKRASATKTCAFRTPSPFPKSSSAPVNVAPPAPTTSKAAPPPPPPKTSTPPPPPPPTTTHKAPPTTSAHSGGGGGGPLSAIVGEVFAGGVATFFWQNGVAGACGTVHPDSSFIVALQTETYANGAHCGKQLIIEDVDTGNIQYATVADECPTCDNSMSIDLSHGLFSTFASDATGQFNVKWGFTSN